MKSARMNDSTIGELLDVQKWHGGVHALRGVSFKLHQGEIVCLLGPNGAGKSTTISLLLGLTKEDSGDVTLFDGHPTDLEVRALIGCTPQDTDFPAHLTVEEILTLVRAHYPHPESLSVILERFGLEPLRKRQSHALSGGQRRCLALACAFIGNPALVLLDEPTTGLDVELRRRLWNSVRLFAAQGGTVLFTTHYLDEAEAMATRVLLMKDGRILREGDIPSIKACLGLKQISFRSEKPIEIEVDGQVHIDGVRYRVTTKQPEAYVRELARRYDDFHDLAIEPLRLEDAFVHLLEDRQV